MSKITDNCEVVKQISMCVSISSTWKQTRVVRKWKKQTDEERQSQECNKIHTITFAIESPWIYSSMELESMTDLSNCTGSRFVTREHSSVDFIVDSSILVVFLFVLLLLRSLQVLLHKVVTEIVGLVWLPKTLNKWFIILSLLHPYAKYTIRCNSRWFVCAVCTLWFLALQFFLFCLEWFAIFQISVNRITMQIEPIVLKQPKQKNK